MTPSGPDPTFAALHSLVAEANMLFSHVHSRTGVLTLPATTSTPLEVPPAEQLQAPPVLQNLHAPPPSHSSSPPPPQPRLQPVAPSVGNPASDGGHHPAGRHRPASHRRFVVAAVKPVSNGFVPHRPPPRNPGLPLHVGKDESAAVARALPSSTTTVAAPLGAPAPISGEALHATSLSAVPKAPDTSGSGSATSLRPALALDAQASAPVRAVNHTVAPTPATAAPQSASTAAPLPPPSRGAPPPYRPTQAISCESKAVPLGHLGFQNSSKISEGRAGVGAAEA